MLIKPETDLVAKIKVVGIGGGGGNAVNTMITDHNIHGVQFLAVNTDAQALANSKADIKLQIGSELTRGLGSGGQPVIGKQSAEESVDMIHENLAGADMVFITAGMGGGTGTGGAPVVAGISKNLGALTVAIVTKPFAFEGKRRMENAIGGIKDLRDKVDTLIVVPNQRLLEIIEKNISFLEAMKRSDDILGQGVRSISDIITSSGFINVDFADVRSVMTEAGSALMGIGEASGDDRAIEAAKQAVNSPLLEISIDGATGVLFNVVGGPDLGLHEVNDAAQVISEHVDPSANIIFGASFDEGMGDTVRITMLATGFDDSKQFDVLSKDLSNSRFKSASKFASTSDDDDDDEEEDYEEEVIRKPMSKPVKKKEEKKPAPGLSNGALGFMDEPAGDADDYDTPAFLRRR